MVAAPDRRPLVLAAATAGLALSPLAAGTVELRSGCVVLVLAGLALTALRPRGRLCLSLALGLALGAGLLAGSARLAAIDGGAYRGAAGRPASVTGIVTSVPRRSRGQVRVEVQTGDGKLSLLAGEPVPDLPIGSEVRAEGSLADPDPFYAPLLRRHGIAMELNAERIDLSGRRRGGPLSLLDAIRVRAESALEHGMREPEAALARGFVLGEDDRIEPRTVNDFKRSGLAHILAVSGQNVVLLAMLAMPLLALAGLGLRGRLVCVLALVLIYVPVAGAGASIQRAGVMGAAGIVAAMAGRPSSRAYAVLLAAFVTLGLNPRSSGDVGWQLSFAAVIGIFLWTSRLAALLPGGRDRSGWRRALAEGVAMSAAATVATAPLMAADFGRVSIAALPANLLALPAMAPAMWLGMLAAAAGQVPGLPVAALNAVNQLVLAYIEQVARWLAEPSWAVVGVRLHGALPVVSACAGLIAAVELALRAGERRAAMRGPGGSRASAQGPGAGGARWRRPALMASLAVALLAAGALALGPPRRDAAASGAPAAGLRVSVLDVGQGDSILLRPAGSEAVLVDGGPPGDAIAGLLREHGVSSLAAAIVTHGESDHEGGILDLLGAMPVRTLDFGEAGPQLLGAGAAAGARPQRLAEGDELRFGELRLEVLWPPRELLPQRPMDAAELDAAGIDPNHLALVMLAEWRHFSMLLSADAEAETTPIDPGPIDVLKVAHHGSADAGLGGLLDRSVPDLAVISVGADNSYGHPTPETLATLREHRVPVMRTDTAGSVEIEVRPGSWAVAAGS
jgi:competence protein ComEC